MAGDAQLECCTPAGGFASDELEAYVFAGFCWDEELG